MILGMSFIENNLYVFQDNALLVYDEAGESDYDGSVDVSIDKRIEVNPISFNESYVKIQNFHISYSSPDSPIKVGVVADGSASKITLKQGTDAHAEKRLPRNAKKNGLLFSFYISVVRDSFSISDVTLIINKALRKAIHRE